jgi:hypothetical protein
MGDCRLEDDGGRSSEMLLVEAGDEPQALWVRVGPVFEAGGVRRREPGVWLSYQEDYMAGPLTGPVLITPAVWRELERAMRWRLRRRGWCRWLRR